MSFLRSSAIAVFVALSAGCTCGDLPVITTDAGGFDAGAPDAGVPDAGCPDARDCSGRLCGADPVCGVSCGTCSGAQEQCVAGQCQCQPACQGKTCGSDGCGGSCGSCSGTQFCSSTQTCQTTDPGCPTAKDCTGRACGPDLNCGLSCGACTGLSACSAAGQCVCQPFVTCAAALAAAGKQCGMVSNGCGGTLNCDSACTSPATCGGGGAADTCGCTPLSCTAALSAAGKQCGTVANGCGGTVNCDSACTSPATCGGGGTANACGCTPLSCTAALTAAGKQCGTVPNGCGAPVNCDSACTAPATCGGGGTANSCGCTPLSCTAALAAAGKQCGTVPNGCGASVNCDSVCIVPATCGGGGTVNVCGTGGTAPVITAQPMSTSVLSSLTATFTAIATGSPTLTYQWRRNGVPIGGATAASYTTPALRGSDDGAKYSVVVTNGAGMATSFDATLTVLIQNRLFVASNVGVLVWDNPSILATQRSADVVLPFAGVKAVTTFGTTLYVASATGAVGRYDNTMATSLSNSTLPNVSMPASGFVQAAPTDLARLTFDGSGLWAWGFKHGASYFPGPLTAASMSQARFTHPFDQTPSLVSFSASSGARLFMGQISGAGLLAWNSPAAKMGTPAADFAIGPQLPKPEVVAWSLGVTPTQLFAGGNLTQSDAGIEPGVLVWNGLPAAATLPNFVLVGSGSGTISTGNFVPDIAVATSPGISDYLVAAVQKGNGSHQLLYWVRLGSLTATSAPLGTASLTNSPARVVVYGGRTYTLSPAAGVAIHTMQSGVMPQVTTVSGANVFSDLAVGP